MSLYLIMAVTGIYSAYYNNFGWTLGVLIAGIIVGTGSEYLGAINGLWSYQFGEVLPFHMIFALAANAFFAVALLKLMGVDVEELYAN